MNRIFYLLITVLALSACGSSKNYLERSNEDNALQDAVKRLKKDPTDEKALEAVPVLYQNIQKAHLARIRSYSETRDINRWDKIISEYNQLQDAYDAILNNDAAFKLINPASYSTELLDAKQGAAEEYYQLAESYMNRQGRENAKKAYNAYKKSDKYVAGYKNADQKMEEAYNNSIVNVVINPVQDNSYFQNNSGFGNYGYNYANEYFQQNLVRDLDNDNSRYAARFFTDYEARSRNINADWIVDLRLRNLDVPYPSNSSYRRNASAQIQIGTDTSGRPVYRTVYATVNITRSSFTARADMEVAIKEIATGKNISYNTFRDDYRWQEERATYSGDSRALSAADWELINNSGYSTPRKEDILNELYRKLYSRVRNNITYSVNW